MRDAVICKPKGNGPFPIILFVQGLGMTMHEWNNSFDEISRRLVDGGFQTVQFEFPIFHDGMTRELPLRERAKIVEEVANEYHPAGLLAQSYGAITTMVAKLPTVKTQLLVSAALSPLHSIKQVYEEVGMKVNYQGDTTMPRSSGENTTIGKEFWNDIQDFDDDKVAKTITIPTCMLHGDHDTKIPVETVQAFFRTIPMKTKKLKIYVGGDHGIVDVPRPQREEFLRDIVQWFQKTI